MKLPVQFAVLLAAFGLASSSATSRNASLAISDATRSPIEHSLASTHPRSLAHQASSSDTWAGGNSFFLYALKDADRDQILDAMQAASLQVVRIFLTSVAQNNKGTGCSAVADVEVGVPGKWNDDILNRVDQLMVAVQQRGMKLIITMHDRWMLGVWGSDVYAAKYGTSGMDVSGFYTNANAAADMDRRFAHVLAHKNPHFDDRAWGDLDEVVLAFGVENESQGGVSQLNFKWVCERATKARQYISNKSILLASGGGREIDTSLHADLMNCDALDILGVHFYGASSSDITSKVQAAVAANKKRIYVEEFGAIGQAKSTDLRRQIDAVKSAGVPWIVWQVSKPGKGAADYEIWTDEPSWQVVQDEAESPGQQTQAWPELGYTGGVAPPSTPGGDSSRGDWEACTASSQCANSCCSKQYSDDGELKCTPGGSADQCVTGAAAGSVGDWETCAVSTDCQNGCCSKKYSDDGKLKCTPGGC